MIHIFRAQNQPENGQQTPLADSAKKSLSEAKNILENLRTEPKQPEGNFLIDPKLVSSL